MLTGLAAAHGCGASVQSVGTRPEAADANAVLPWAFVLNDSGLDGADTPDPNEVVTVPGSGVSMRRSDINININSGPPDWHPDSHPPMPEVVARGGGEGVVACGYCHLPNQGGAECQVQNGFASSRGGATP